MDGTIVGHWQHGTGMIVRDMGEMAVVLFEDDNRERMLAKANLTNEAGQPLVSPLPEPVGRVVRSKREETKEHIYEYVRDAGRPVFADYPSAARIVEELKARGANISSAGTVTSTLSTLRKEGRLAYAEGVKGSGYIAVQSMV